MNLIKKILKSAFIFLTLLNKIISKNKNQIFFYSNLGFRDNVKALFDYLIDNEYNKTYQIIVSCDDYLSFEGIELENVRFVGLKKGLLFFLTSKYCFYSFGKYPIMPSRNQVVVNLWHGMPLKAIGRLVKGSEKEKQNYFSHIIATSDFFADIMCKAFGCRKKQVILTPQPRCDIFKKDMVKPDFLSGFDKIVFWLPTFLSSKRLGVNDGEYNELNPYNLEFLQGIQKQLSLKNILLVIKPHPMDDVTSFAKEFKNILRVTDKDLNDLGHNLYTVLKFTDALVTDFSSIYFDYLMLDKPIAFFGVDAKKYGEKRGFVTDDILSIMPGYHIKTQLEFFEFLEDVSSGKDGFSDARKKCNELCNPLRDSFGCQKILYEINLKKSEEN